MWAEIQAARNWLHEAEEELGRMDAAAGNGPWEIEVASPALKGFRRLPEKAAATTVEFVTGVLADNPYRLSKSLMNELLGLRTARRGDYRVLFTLTSKSTSCLSTALNTDPTSTSLADQPKSRGRCILSGGHPP